jgi:hypothetical protein
MLVVRSKVAASLRHAQGSATGGARLNPAVCENRSAGQSARLQPDRKIPVQERFKKNMTLFPNFFGNSVK